MRKPCNRRQNDAAKEHWPTRFIRCDNYYANEVFACPSNILLIKKLYACASHSTHTRIGLSMMMMMKRWKLGNSVNITHFRGFGSHAQWSKVDQSTQTTIVRAETHNILHQTESNLRMNTQTGPRVIMQEIQLKSPIELVVWLPCFSQPIM